MTPEEYAAFVTEVRASHGDEEAARLIEARCHPPLPYHLQRGPVVVDVREQAAARKGTAGAFGSVAESLGDAG